MPASEVHPACHTVSYFLPLYHEVMFHVREYQNLLSYSPTEGILVYFQYLMVTNKTVMNIHMEVLCEHKFSFLVLQDVISFWRIALPDP